VVCRSEFVTTQAARRVGVFPLDRSSVSRVGVDVAPEFARQIGDRGEDAAGNDFALDFGEPQFDLVEPGRIGGREVKLHAGMPLEEIPNQLRFMSGEVIEDDMDLLPGRAQRDYFFQKGHEVAAGVANRSFSVDATGLRVQRGVQRKRAMSVVLEAMTLGAARGERQNRVESIQSLNRGFFIDREHGGVLRRIQIEAENVGRFALKLRIVAGQITLQAVGFEAGFLQTRCTASLLTPSAAASLRQLQWVEPSLGFLRVADKIRARKAGVRTVAFCPG